MPANPSVHPVRLGLAGLGTVGAAVFEKITANQRLLAERTGFTFEIVRVAVRKPGKRRPAGVPLERVVDDWRLLVDDPAIETVVELIGGTTDAFDLVASALRAGKSVVTGNKALLAERGAEIFRLAAETGQPVFFEAAVAGGVPVIKAVKESLVGNHIASIHGIINGTSNYILTRMTEQGLDFGEALAEAQAKGYAEADPTLDVNGWDAAHKAIILASLSYGYWVRMEDIHVEGLERVARQDIAYAAKLGFTIKLVAVIKLDAEGEVEVRVQPSLVRKEHILASVGGVHNAIAIRGDMVGEVMFFGPGAGGHATASAVLADIVDAAHARRHGPLNPGFVVHGLYGRTKPVERTVTDYYLRIPVNDQPGVIAGIAGVLAGKRIGIGATVSLPPSQMPEGKFTEVIFMTHEAPYGLMREAVVEIAHLPYVTGQPVVFRVEGL